MIYHTRGEYTNHYITDAITFVFTFVISLFQVMYWYAQMHLKLPGLWLLWALLCYWLLL